MTPIRFHGRIKAVNSYGYGFIETSQGIDFFMHQSQFNGNWKQMLTRYVSGEQLMVEFENDPTSPSGPRAKNVVIVSSITE